MSEDEKSAWGRAGLWLISVSPIAAGIAIYPLYLLANFIMGDYKNYSSDLEGYIRIACLFAVSIGCVLLFGKLFSVWSAHRKRMKAEKKYDKEYWG